VFKNQRKGRRDPSADLQIALEVAWLKHTLGKTDAAVVQVAKKFNLSRSAVFEAIARDKRERKL
jgi:hypothetical protein